jgi:hypothetical protein
MKKLIGIMVAVVMMIGLSACSKNNGTTGPTVTTRTAIVIFSNGITPVSIQTDSNSHWDNPAQNTATLVVNSSGEKTINGYSGQEYSFSFTKDIEVWASGIGYIYIFVDGNSEPWVYTCFSTGINDTGIQSF